METYMLRASDVIDIPLIVSNNKTEFRIIDPIVDISNTMLPGFLIARGGWQGGARVVLWEDVKFFAQDGLYTELRSPVINIATVMRVKQLLENPIRLVGRAMLSRQGEYMGEITDFYFSQSTGELCGLELSDPVKTDVDLSLSYIPILQPLDLVNGVVVASADMLATIRENGNASDELDPDPDTEPAAQLEAARGHRLHYDVRNEQNLIIAAAGQIVTDNIIAVTRKLHQEVALLQAAGFII